MSVTHQTLDISQVIPAPLDTVWAAFQDTTSRSVWSVPKGDDLVYSKDDFRPGGRASYRCGPSGDLNVAGEIEYIQIIPHELVVHTDTVSTGGALLATALVTWTFEPHDDGALVTIVDQVASFVGQDMIDGHRNGHTIALAQLAEFLKS